MGTPAISLLPPLPREVGHCYVFMREGHDWHSDTVAVLSKGGPDHYKVARSSDVCESLLQLTGRRKKIKTWTCKHEELW